MRQALLRSLQHFNPTVKVGQGKQRLLYLAIQALQHLLQRGLVLALQGTGKLLLQLRSNAAAPHQTAENPDMAEIDMQQVHTGRAQGLYQQLLDFDIAKINIIF